MKYELETIPIWDTYKEKPLCPLCTLENRAEQNYLAFFLGTSVMNPELRVEVNKNGFCPEHFSRLYDSRENRHGLGLLTHTHLMEMRKNLALPRKAGALAGSGGEKKLKKLLQVLTGNGKKCMICSRLEGTLKRYAFTIVYLWKKEPPFRDQYRVSGGFCLHHLPLVLSMVPETLRGKDRGEFITATMEIMEKSLLGAEENLMKYTENFSFEKTGQEWGEERTALAGAIQKLTGKTPGI